MIEISKSKSLNVFALGFLLLFSACRGASNRGESEVVSDPEMFFASAKIIKLDLSTLAVEFFSNPGVLLLSSQDGRLTAGEISFKAGVERKEEDRIKLTVNVLIQESEKEPVDLKHSFVARAGEEKSFSDLIREDGENYLWVVIAKAEEKTFPLEPKKRIRDGRREENEEDKPVPEVEIEWH